MGVSPQIFFGKVMHGRLFPKRNFFTYGIYYLSIPLSDMRDITIAHNRFSALSFYDRDHGLCDGSNLNDWGQKILKDHGIEEDLDITLVCMPRVFGYVFNPVSFWLCRNTDNQLKAVLCEVHNTFGERHTYICAHEDLSEILEGEIISGQKLFHVSPFLKREGCYDFRFSFVDDKFGAWIDFYDGEGKKQLVTSLVGNLEKMDKKNLNKAFWFYPLVTFKAIILIHWQAFNLVSKGIKYISRPKQLAERISQARSSEINLKNK